VLRDHLLQQQMNAAPAAQPNDQDLPPERLASPIIYKIICRLRGSNLRPPQLFTKLFADSGVRTLDLPNYLNIYRQPDSYHRPRLNLRIAYAICIFK
jgi:hypothetical protein